MTRFPGSRTMTAAQRRNARKDAIFEDAKPGARFDAGWDTGDPLSEQEQARRGEMLVYLSGETYITAVFPCEPANYSGTNMSGYAHIGQHCSCGRAWYNSTRAAKPEEYADLQRELESAPYGYRLKVYKRMQPWMRKALTDEQTRLCDRPAA